MGKSTQVITDCKTVAAGTPSTDTVKKMIAADGPIGDVSSNASLLLLKAQEMLVLAKQMKASMDGSDPLLTTLQEVIDVLV